MSDAGPTWVGADPGGDGCFGVAILGGDGRCHTYSVGYVDAAIEGVCRHVHSAPAGVGIDAPLWWSSGPAGRRKADEWIREQYGLPPREVQAVNSMWGAALAQGMMFVARMRQTFPGVRITETHPKAVLKALGQQRWTEYFGPIPTEIRVDSEPDHERDALISAVAAREGFEGRWKRNLALDRHPSEQHPGEYWLAPVNYFWPD